MPTLRDPHGRRAGRRLSAELPDTPPMAVDRGRIDLLEGLLRRDPTRRARTFSPLAWGQRFHDQDGVSAPAMRLIAARGGRP